MFLREAVMTETGAYRAYYESPIGTIEIVGTAAGVSGQGICPCMVMCDLAVLNYYLHSLLGIKLCYHSNIHNMT